MRTPTPGRIVSLGPYIVQTEITILSSFPGETDGGDTSFRNHLPLGTRSIFQGDKLYLRPAGALQHHLFTP
jgi:hypothetical protein